MPQLNPTPWLFTMLTTWLTINILLTLINNFNLTHPTEMINNQTKSNPPMTWPW